MHEYDNSFIFMPLSEAQSFFHLPDAVSGIEVYSDAPLKIELLRRAIAINLAANIASLTGRNAIKAF